MVIKGYLCNMYNTKIMKTFLITFSPTGTSRKVGEAIARGIDPECIVYDYMKGRCAITVPAGAVAVVSVPVYGGHVPQLFMATATTKTRLWNLATCSAPVVFA